jgi:hypothetical protein
MRTLHIRSLSLAALAFLVFASNVVAQDKSPALLNTHDLQQLVARAEPADQARLSAHFTALAEQYTADATRHRAMSQSFSGNPGRSLGTSMSAHCKRLAELDTQSATTVRELAAYHQTLAGGATATAPHGGAHFEAGAGAAAPTDQELGALAAKAGTPADHHALEEYFQKLAKRDSAAATGHAAMAQAYRGTKIAQAAAHCDQLVTLSKDSAKEATAAAAMHKQLAAVAK